MPTSEKVAIVGVGLLGGSIALALKERELASEVVGIGRNAERLGHAVAGGIVDRATTHLAEGLADASVVIICTPVELVASGVVQAVAAAQEGCLVTDVASTKERVVAEVEAEIASRGHVVAGGGFIGSHPLAGDHRSGASFARADLFVGRTVVVTPTLRTPATLARRARDFWESLDAKVVEMAPDAHDVALALTSHLPHVVASALARATPFDLLSLVAGGWSDTTRIAGADAALWRQILTSNRQHVLAALEQINQSIETFRAALASEQDDRLEQLLAEGKRVRDAVGS